MRYTQVSADCFVRFLKRAWDFPKGDTVIRDMLDPDALSVSHYEGARCYLANDCKSGYVVRPNYNENYKGDLQTVWSIASGRGKELVENAIRHGAYSLDCFDGFLPKFYASLGFVEYAREKNWNEGGPDVVFMRRV